MDLKVEMKRIYSRMNWNFVYLVLKKFGSQEQFVTWVMGCKPFFAIFINDLQIEWFSSTMDMCLDFFIIVLVYYCF